MKSSLFVLTAFFFVTACSSTSTRSATAWKKHIVEQGPGPAPFKYDPNNVGADVNTVVAHDFDNDGHVDIIASYAGKVVLYKGPTWDMTVIMEKMPPDWTGRVAKRGCIHSTIMDVDRDGDIDYVGSNRMLFWLECPKKPFQDKWQLRMINLQVNGAHCLITGDVDRDGEDDLIANSWRDKSESTIPDSITWFKIPQQPRANNLWSPYIFANQDAPGRNHYMAFADVNKDGRGDVACAGPAGGWVAWWEQPQDPSVPWTKHVISDNDPGATNVVAADFNGDGHMDYVVSRGHTAGVIWFAGPTFTRHEIDMDLKTPHCLATADLNGDGDMDFATCGSGLNGIVAMYENNGAGQFTRHVLDVNQSAYDLRLVDLDRDGDLDLLYAGKRSRNVVWYENPLR